MHTRQNSLYFCINKIKIHVQKNIKVGQFIEKLCCQKIVLGFEGLKWYSKVYILFWNDKAICVTMR